MYSSTATSNSDTAIVHAAAHIDFGHCQTQTQLEPSPLRRRESLQRIPDTGVISGCNGVAAERVKPGEHGVRAGENPDSIDVGFQLCSWNGEDGHAVGEIVEI